VLNPIFSLHNPQEGRELKIVIPKRKEGRKWVSVDACLHPPLNMEEKRETVGINLGADKGEKKKGRGKHTFIVILRGSQPTIHTGRKKKKGKEKKIRRMTTHLPYTLSSLGRGEMKSFFRIRKRGDSKELLTNRKEGEGRRALRACQKEEKRGRE